MRNYLRAPLEPAELYLCVEIFHNFENPPAPLPICSTAPDFLDIRPWPRPSGACNGKGPFANAQGLHGLPHALRPSQYAPNVKSSPKKRVREMLAVSAVHGSTPLCTTTAHGVMLTPTHGSMPLKKPCDVSLHVDAPLPEGDGAPAVKAKTERGKRERKEDAEAKDSQKRGRIRFDERQVALEGHTYLTSRKVSGSDINRAQCAFPTVAREKLKKCFNVEMVNNRVYEYLDRYGHSYKATYKEWKCAEAFQDPSFNQFYEQNYVKENDILHMYVIHSKLGNEGRLRFRLIKYVNPLKEDK